MSTRNSLRYLAALAGVIMGITGIVISAHADPVTILECSGTGIGGDRADLRGIRFTVDQDFSAVEVRMEGRASGTYRFSAELRRSTGFSVAAERTVHDIALEVPGEEITPFVPVRIAFNEVSVSGEETFTLKFTNVTGPEVLYFETFGIGNEVCEDVEETEQNTGSSPTVRGDPAGFRVLAGDPLVITSSYTTSPPTLDGSLGFGEWPISNRIQFENGFLTVVNDRTRLYVLVDLIEDSGDDTGPDGDYFWLTFDVDRDGEITPEVDINYGTVPSTGNMRYSYYLGAGSLSYMQPDTFSAKARGFGCFFGDGSLIFGIWPSPGVCNNHRVWEFGIDLMEIGTQAGGITRMGLRASSPDPSFTEEIPNGFLYNFTNLIQVRLGAPSGFIIMPYIEANVHLEDQPLEVTQAIQTRSNNAPLVQDRKTMARVYVDVDGTVSAQPSIVSLYGSKSGVDLPGSPLALFHNAPSTINREVLGNTANYVLPNSWDEGTVTFQAKVRDLFERESASGYIPLGFTAKETPTYWIVPINTGTASVPNVVSNAEITEQETYLKAIYPVPNVNFVRKPWQTIGPTTVANTIDDLNDLYGQVFLAWIFGLLFTGGEPPFDLPDHIYGFCPSGGGLSNPEWGGGLGVVARGYRGTSEEGTMAHEMIHNLGTGNCSTPSAGFWGRHVSSEGRLSAIDDPTGQCIPVGGDPGGTYGCGAAGPDKDWQALFNDGDIQEVGVDLTVTPSRIVSDSTPEIMTYCGSGSPPTKWISPYRWQRMFDNFSTLATAAKEPDRLAGILQEIQDVYYVSGTVYPGRGKLNPVTRQKGIPSQGMPEGPYQIRLLGQKEEQLLVLYFTASFFEKEAGEDQRVPFSFQLPAVQGVALVELIRGQEILDRIRVSNSPPEVRVEIPNGGEVWKGGMEKIQWTARDADGDTLYFNILFSPDGARTWIPVANKVTETGYEVDTSTLPGGEKAFIRVIATDGFHTAQDDSDEPFRLLPGPPEVSILEPGEGALFEPGFMIHFVGSAMDKEDGFLPDESFVWSFGDTVFAQGKDVHAALPIGTHLIKLTVYDRDGMDGSAAVEIQVASLCNGDFNHDGDVDGSDLAHEAELFATGQGDPAFLAVFAEEFGQTDCGVLPPR